jgi:actin-like ATPase involved in cell morphogenesis
MVLETYITKGVRIKMDQEIKDYLERKLTLLATKDDIEKIRQETNANFRKLKEENKSQATEWRQEIKADMEKITPSSRIEIGPIREEIKEWVRKIEDGTQFALSQFRQTMDSSLQRMKETGEGHADHSTEGLDRVPDQMKKIEENMGSLEEKIREGFVGAKDELGSMIKFSYSDLEKKLAALEARVKTLEKIVLD